MAANANDTGALGPAEIYDRHFVPALFAQWAGVVAGLAGIGAGHRVLDVACGTGVLARAAAGLAGPGGAVTGLDASEEMLAVARAGPGAVEWVEGTAESLPFADADFDRVVSQFGFMFFADQAGALREMRRVLRPGGRLAVAVCDAVDRSPGYSVFAELLQRLFGAEVAEGFRAPFTLGDPRRLQARCREAGIADAEVASHTGSVRFESVAALVDTEGACVWTLGGLLDAEQLARLREEAERSLQPFVTAQGTLEFAMPALVLTATAT